MADLSRHERASIIIPAHNEAANIWRLLDAITVFGWEENYEIIVSCNACTDETVDIVKRYIGVVCVDSAIPSKINALNLAEKHAKGFPRVYVDADVQINHYSVMQLLYSLRRREKPTLAAPLANINIADSSFLVKCYYHVWLRSRYCLIDGYGSGVYALNRSARALFDSFPSVISDDGFVRKILPDGSVFRVSEAVSCVQSPRTFSDLVKIKTRSKLGNIQLGQIIHAAGRKKSSGKIHLQKSSLPQKLIYWCTNALALVQAKLKSRNLQGYRWQRDESSRS